MAFTGAAIFGAASSIGAAAAGAGAAVAGAASALAPIITAGSGVAGIFSAVKGVSQPAAMPQLQQAPRVPDYAAIQSAEKTSILRAAQKRTKTVLTNPMGETDGAIIKTKQLVGKLGQ